MSRLLAALVVLVALASCKDRILPAADSSTVTKAEKPKSQAPPAEATVRWQAIAEGARYRFFQDAPRTKDVSAHVLELDLGKVRLRAVDNLQTGQTKTAQQAADEQAALAGINGTFFDPKGRPLGLLVDGGQVFNPLRKADWGVFYVVEGKAQLVHTSEYSVDSSHEFAVQCGPRIVIAGKVPKLKKQGSHRRSGLCVVAPSKVVVFATEGSVSTEQMGRFLAASPATGGLGCKDAMLLDGGPSTQFVVKHEDFRVSVKGLWPVPNVVLAQLR